MFGANGKHFFGLSDWKIPWKSGPIKLQTLQDHDVIVCYAKYPMYLLSFERESWTHLSNTSHKNFEKLVIFISISPHKDGSCRYDTNFFIIIIRIDQHFPLISHKGSSKINMNSTAMLVSLQTTRTSSQAKFVTKWNKFSPLRNSRKFTPKFPDCFF